MRRSHASDAFRRKEHALLLSIASIVIWRDSLAESDDSGLIRGQRSIAVTLSCYLIARNHDGRTGAFPFWQLTSGRHADFQLLRFAADNWTVEVRLMQSILEAAASRTAAIARFQINAGPASLWRGAGLNKGRSFYNF